MEKIRLDKYLADMGQGTRSEVKKWIRKGAVSVNGETVKSPEYKVNCPSDQVSIQGRQVQYEKFEYYMLNKPAGTVSAREDSKEPTVLDLIRSKKRKDLFPVGRLDKDTEGLLLITNDGALAHDLLSPKKHVDKTYFVQLLKELKEEEKEQLEKGVDIGDEKPTLPAEVIFSEKKDQVYITIPSDQEDVPRGGQPGGISEAGLHGQPEAGRKASARRLPRTDQRRDRRVKRTCLNR